MSENERLSELIGRVAREDEDSFARLYEITSRRVFQYLCRLSRDRVLAEDILLDTYTEVWRSAEKFRGRSRVLTWITGIARNLMFNEFRRRKVTEYELDEDIASPLGQFDECADAEIAQLLGRALDRLPVKQREALDLLFLQGMRYEEISVIMGIPVNTVKTRVFYAKERLRSILSSMGVTRSDLI